MNANRKSDESVVPATSANNGAAEAPAEPAEERDSAKRNAKQTVLRRTPGRIKRKSRGLHGVREAARKDSTLKFTALLHHVNEDCLTEAFFNLKKTAAVGVDGVTWQEYERSLEANIAGLHDRIHRGAYRAQPSRRVWIPKPDGRQRPLGIASLEDKIVQQAVLWVLQSIYEQDFLGISYGFRPGRSQHNALDALSVAITSKRVNWILDADIEGFFDAIDHEWLVKFLEHRIGFESHNEATACLEALHARFAKFGLKLHEKKTRLIEFGRYAIERRKRRDEGRPETFDFLGFTHKCARTRKQGWFAIHRHSVAKRMRATLQAIKAQLRKRMHRPLGETARWLRRVVQGWLNYHAVPSNSHRIGRFVDEVTRLWLKVIRHRSQRGRRR